MFPKYPTFVHERVSTVHFWPSPARKPARWSSFCPRNSHKPSHALVSICLNVIFLLLGKSLNRFSAVRNLKPLTGSLKVLAGIQELNDYNIIGLFVLLERKNESTDRNSTTTVLDKTETMNKHYKPNVEEEKVNTLHPFSNGIQYNYNTISFNGTKTPQLTQTQLRITREKNAAYWKRQEDEYFLSYFIIFSGKA